MPYLKSMAQSRVRKIDKITVIVDNRDKIYAHEEGSFRWIIESSNAHNPNT